MIFALPLLLALLPAQDAPKREIVSFEFSNSQSKPSQYIVQIDRTCSATYTEKGGEEQNEELVEQSSNDIEDTTSKTALVPAKPAEAEREEQAVPKRFNFSPATCRQIFDLAKSANYFSSDVQFRKHKVAYTGDRVLGYFGPGVSHKAAFSWSEIPSIQQLSAIFEGTVATLESGPKLEHALKFDKLGLNELLAGMERQAEGHYLRELWLIAPTLKQIANDSRVMNIARQRAQRLLQQAEALAPAPQAASSK